MLIFPFILLALLSLVVTMDHNTFLLLIGIAITGGLLILILSKKVSALTALIIVPIAGALLAGFGLETFEYALAGIRNIAPVAAMFIFAILFFGILTDAGMFDPVINFILRLVGNHPERITVGAAVLAMIVHLDGSGAVTFLIAIPAMLPLFEKLDMDKRVLAAVVALGAGTMNLVPWGGPTIRAATALDLDITEVYNPIIIPQLAGLAFVLIVAWYLGKKENKRLGSYGKEEFSVFKKELTEEEKEMRRPKNFIPNVLVTLASIVILITGWIPPALVFMLGFIIVLTLNYPNLKQQKTRIDAHAKACILMGSILLAAGVFTGIMQESGLLNIMASETVKVFPEGSGNYLPTIVALFSMPLSFFFDPDSYYFGFLPVLAGVGSGLGIEEVTMAQASLFGQMTTGFPLSPLTPTTFLLIGLTGIDLGEHQKFTFKYAFLTTIVMTIVALLLGILPMPF